MEDDDAALLAAIGDGSERAFNRFIDRHQQALRTFVRGLTRDADEGDDIAQETFLAVWSQAAAFRGDCTARSWLLAIAWRKAKDIQRAWFRRRARETAHHELRSFEARAAAPPEQGIAIRQALAALPLAQRAAVLLCLGCGLTHNEAADVLCAPLGTVKSHVVRGRERLHELLGGTP